MDKFKLFFESRENAYSWLSPNGEFVPLPGNDSHTSWAMNFLKERAVSAVQKMYQLGFLRIQFNGNILYCENTFQFPNYKQEKQLIDLAISGRFTEVIYDNGEKLKTIWSENDQF